MKTSKVCIEALRLLRAFLSRNYVRKWCGLFLHLRRKAFSCKAFALVQWFIRTGMNIDAVFTASPVLRWRSRIFHGWSAPLQYSSRFMKGRKGQLNDGKDQMLSPQSQYALHVSPISNDTGAKQVSEQEILGAWT